MRRLLVILALAAASVGAAGCNDYHYYDVSVSFNIGSGTNQFAVSGEVSTIQVMVMTVSGADNGSIQIGPNANGLPLNSGTTLGTFEFSTFADSGQLTFTATAFDDANSTPDCKTGQGSKAVDASSMTTNDLALVVDKTGPGCQ
jgi:hypothetical protein